MKFVAEIRSATSAANRQDRANELGHVANLIQALQLPDGGLAAGKCNSRGIGNCIIQRGQRS
jgi:hypothetical protein